MKFLKKKNNLDFNIKFVSFGSAIFTFDQTLKGFISNFDEDEKSLSAGVLTYYQCLFFVI